MKARRKSSTRRPAKKRPDPVEEADTTEVVAVDGMIKIPIYPGELLYGIKEAQKIRGKPLGKKDDNNDRGNFIYLSMTKGESKGNVWLWTPQHYKGKKDLKIALVVVSTAGSIPAPMSFDLSFHGFKVKQFLTEMKSEWDSVEFSAKIVNGVATEFLIRSREGRSRFRLLGHAQNLADHQKIAGIKSENR